MAPRGTPSTKKKRTAKKSGKIRFPELLAFDREMMSGGQISLFDDTPEHLIGVDEVGRGCLAGPVVAAAVILPEESLRNGLGEELSALNDSKVLSAETRSRLNNSIRAGAHWAIGEASPEEIDDINILWASLLAMRRAIESLAKKTKISRRRSLILVDGNRPIKNILTKQIPVIKGDSRSASIAAASVVAKVHRDSLMVTLSQEFPDYRWESNKGYGSIEHRRAIKAFGMTRWHRTSFRCLDESLDDSLEEYAEEIPI